MFRLGKKNTGKTHTMATNQNKNTLDIILSFLRSRFVYSMYACIYWSYFDSLDTNSFECFFIGKLFSEKVKHKKARNLV